MDLSYYFKTAIEKDASDLHLVAGCRPMVRIQGELVKISDDILTADGLEQGIYSLISDRIKQKFIDQLEVDFSLHFGNSRFRINLHHQEGKVGIAARLVPEFIPRPEELDFNETMYKFTHLADGLVLLVGPTGSGKSTTLAAMLDIINQERQAHIITIEDPIEYVIKEKQSIVEQRELGQDTKSYASALKYALRQDPNVIMVGEMRDLETIRAALIAAETGHLVFSTLHTSTAAETIDRILDVFPAYQQRQIAISLTATLRGVIVQQLLPSTNGGRIVAREIMINTKAISNLMKEGKINQIDTVIQTSRKEGMISMNKSLEDLLERRLITKEVASNRMRRSDTSITFY